MSPAMMCVRKTVRSKIVKGYMLTHKTRLKNTHEQSTSKQSFEIECRTLKKGNGSPSVKDKISQV